MRLPVVMLLPAALLAGAGTSAQAPEPLVTAGDFQMAGAFRLPASGGTNETSFAWGGTALAFDPWRQSLWLTGHAWYQRIAEISIPTPVDAPGVSALPRAAIRTPWIETEWRKQVADRTVNVGGILPQPNGDLVVSAYAYYDAVGAQVSSHFRIGADGAVGGPFTLNTRSSAVAPRHAGSVSGYMTPIPPQWQQALGGQAFVGQCCISIISRTSFGPALSVFNPPDVGTVNPVPVKEVLGYPADRTTLGSVMTQGGLYNGSVTDGMAGPIFPPGTRSVLFIQRMGTGPVSYNAGYAAPPYEVRVLAYDVHDLVAAKNGRRRPWQVVPYANWRLPIGDVQVEGVAFDPQTRRVFLSVAHQDGEQPVIRVMTIAPTGPSAQ